MVRPPQVFGSPLLTALTSGLHPNLANIQVLLMWFIRVHSTWAPARDSALRSIRAPSPDHSVPSQSGPTDVGSDGLNRRLFRGIPGARTRGAGPVGQRKGPPATTGWTPRGRSSRCAAALRSGVVKRNVGTPDQWQVSAPARSQQRYLFARFSSSGWSPAHSRSRPLLDRV
jgi:hypothetical protein